MTETGTAMTGTGTGSTKETGATMTRTEVAQAVATARVAATAWSRLSPADRAGHMLRVRRKLIDRMDDVVATIVSETGKVATEAVVNEVLVTCELIGWYARHAPRLLRSERVGTGLLAHKSAEKRYEPLGVVGVISPWNYPLVLAMGPVATALFAGNAVVLKPSEITPRVGLLVGELFSSMDEHPGIVQVVTGGSETGDALVRSGADKIAFTGSVRTGKAVMRAAADTLTPVLLELGGKDPLIVCGDADIDRAARAAVWGAFTNCGQTCMATERVYVVEKVYQAFVDRVVELTAKVRQGAGSGYDIGAVTHRGQLSIIDRHLADAVERGAVVASGGKPVDVGGRPSLEPTVLLEVDHSMAVMRDETFGPILPIMKVRDEQEALELANDSPYGLNASVFGRDRATVERLVSGLRSGNVCVNDVMVSYAIPALPFGGAKESGMGRSHGAEGLREFTQIKSIARDRFGLHHEPQWLPLPPKLGSVIKIAMRLRYADRPWHRLHSQGDHK
ncbi:MAG: aldehyde dehydrogenase family protein [Acidimicrobiales bacterium]